MKSNGKRQISKGKSGKRKKASLFFIKRKKQSADLLLFDICLLPFDLTRFNLPFDFS